METPPSNDCLKASLSPPVGGRLRFSEETGKQTNAQTLCYTFLPLIIKFARVPLDLSGPKAHQDSALASYPVSCVKNTVERVENVKSLWFLQSPVPNPQASPRVEANDRHKQAQPPFLLVERFKWKLQSPSGPL